MKRGRGHVELRAGSWWLRPSTTASDGRRRQPRILLGAASKLRSEVAARRVADAWLAEHGDPASAGPGIRAGAVFGRFLKVDCQNVRASSRRRYERLLRRHVIPHLASRPVAELGTATLREHLAALAAKGLSRSTLIGVRTIILQALRAAEADGKCTLPAIDPRRIKIPSAAKPARPIYPIEAHELALILENSTWPWRALWAVLGYAGLRIGEALALQWGDVNFRGHRIEVARSLSSGEVTLPKTKGSKGAVPMLPWLERILANYRPAWRPNAGDWLFSTREGTPYRADNVRRRQWYPLLHRLSLKRRGLHSFRHGLPAMLLDMGVQADAVRDLLRHRSLAETERYSRHRTDEVRRAVVAALARAADNSAQPVSDRAHEAHGKPPRRSGSHEPQPT